LDEVRRDFVANAGDELRRPVLAIRALARLLTEEVGTRSSDARIALRIGEEAAAMDRTVDDLVELAQLESEPWRHPEAAPVSMIVDEAVGSVMALARRRKVSLQVAEVDSGAAVAGEPRQLAVALARLIENAVNHSGEHEVVTVEANAVGHRVDLVVRDQGVGVNDEDAERIFEPFYRGARSGEAAGAGLGLSVVRHVAARHGGTVLLDSRPGEGSAFVLRLPAA
jgi:two-component system sensor histidine kinase SenX3